MTQGIKPKWESKRTAETRKVEEALRKEFQQVDAYRYNSASIRVRVIDPRFEGKSAEKRDAMVEKHLAKLPKATQADIMNLLTLTPEEMKSPDTSSRAFLLNVEFEEPSPSEL
jgi:stress-induced morphogen